MSPQCPSEPTRKTSAPVAYEDDAERAVRTGLEMQRCCRERSHEFGGLPLRRPFFRLVSAVFSVEQFGIGA